MKGAPLHNLCRLEVRIGEDPTDRSVTNKVKRDAVKTNESLLSAGRHQDFGRGARSLKNRLNAMIAGVSFIEANSFLSEFT